MAAVKHGNVIIISTLNERSPWVWQLVDEAKKVARVVLVHTRPNSEPVKGTVTVRADHIGLHFQKWANLGLEQCQGPTAIINDDILISADDIALMLDKVAAGYSLVTLPGRVGASPLTGWCFALDPAKYRYDEKYTWHYGDDDLWEQAKASGDKVGVVSAAIVHDRGDHPRYPIELRAKVQADKMRFERKWKRGTRRR